MAAQTLSVYVKDLKLFEEIKKAQEEKTINVIDVCTRALKAELHPEDTPEPEPIAPVFDDEAMRRAAAALDAQLNEPQGTIQYEISVSRDALAAQAFLDMVTAQGAWPVSLSVDNLGQHCFVIAYPVPATPAP